MGLPNDERKQSDLGTQHTRHDQVAIADKYWVIDYCPGLLSGEPHGLVHQEPTCLQNPCLTHGGPNHLVTHREISANNSQANPAMGSYFTIHYPGRVCFDCRVQRRAQGLVFLWSRRQFDHGIIYENADDFETGSKDWWQKLWKDARVEADAELKKDKEGPDEHGR